MQAVQYLKYWVRMLERSIELMEVRCRREHLAREVQEMQMEDILHLDVGGTAGSGCLCH